MAAYSLTTARAGKCACSAASPHKPPLKPPAHVDADVTAGEPTAHATHTVGRDRQRGGYTVSANVSVSQRRWTAHTAHALDAWRELTSSNGALAGHSDYKPPAHSSGATIIG